MVGSSLLSVVEVIDDRGPKIEIIQDLVLSEVLQQIHDSGLRLKHRPDVLIWKHSLEGDFATKYAREISRQRGQLCD